jgi:hypothetical protein
MTSSDSSSASNGSVKANSETGGTIQSSSYSDEAKHKDAKHHVKRKDMKRSDLESRSKAESSFHRESDEHKKAPQKAVDVAELVLLWFVPLSTILSLMSAWLWGILFVFACFKHRSALKSKRALYISFVVIGALDFITLIAFDVFFYASIAEYNTTEAVSDPLYALAYPGMFVLHLALAVDLTLWTVLSHFHHQLHRAYISVFLIFTWLELIAMAIMNIIFTVFN